MFSRTSRTVRIPKLPADMSVDSFPLKRIPPDAGLAWVDEGPDVVIVGNLLERGDGRTQHDDDSVASLP